MSKSDITESSLIHKVDMYEKVRVFEYEVDMYEKVRVFETPLEQVHKKCQMEETIRAASQEVSNEFKTLVKVEDLNSLRHLQHLILGRLQDSNAVLSHYNEFAENCFSDVSLEFARSTRLLKSMKADLDYIFLKLRSIKSKILATYPDAFPDDSTSDAFDRRPDLELPQ
ncbi:kxDL motif protein [Arabidopsis thaliana]|uniref:KxDL motif protein n=2 Tax=Arabidopsis thaliana TaxID=3702 RepID=F4J1T2_ARATH|nr:kxDL motif protein [Arabidopsis thaliana]AEE77539.1 kxDL motif protein [Arabidopsis thaliana]|eukprot:NP_001189998.1 kxDL motif protein [Arabidopsis thaliana]